MEESFRDGERKSHFNEPVYGSVLHGLQRRAQKMPESIKVLVGDWLCLHNRALNWVSQHDNVLSLFKFITRTMYTVEMTPSTVMFTTLIKGFNSISRMLESLNLFWEILEKCHGTDLLTYTTWMDSFVKSDAIEQQKTFTAL
eukprot:Gb_00314 [translate_table: standard]